MQGYQAAMRQTRVVRMAHEKYKYKRGVGYEER